MYKIYIDKSFNFFSLSRLFYNTFCKVNFLVIDLSAVPLDGVFYEADPSKNMY